MKYGMDMKYGIIGNCKTSALVHESGSIDWLCLPRFDSPSVFAALLDPDGGMFRIRLAGPCSVKQAYIPQTNILRTEFDGGESAFELVDFMPRYKEGDAYHKPLEIHRIVRVLKGRPLVTVAFRPRLDYARGKTMVRLRPGVITASHGLESIFLYSSLPLEEIIGETPMPLEGEHFFLLTYHEKIVPPTLDFSISMHEKTGKYWEMWSGRCRLPKLDSGTVLRSALTLKLMTYEDTGAIVAAPTTSLPEILGEPRNWDYRYCWLRDASLMLESLKIIGHFEEAGAFIHFLLKIFESKRTKIQIVYGIDGRTNLDESVLEHLKGYKNTTPVRIGNHAFHTRQNDIFGEILNTIYLYYFHYKFEKINDEVWSLVKFLVNTVVMDWSAPDAGIWEFRHKEAHFTFSKVLSWVAVDRGISIAGKLGKNYAVENWKPVREKIHKDICDKGWNEKKGAFAQIYGGATFDASLLLMCRYGFLSADNPRWISTVRRYGEALVKDGFAFRYTSADDFGKPKNAFILATFWLSKAFYSIGEKEKAMELFERAASCANHLGLLSEDIDLNTGELLGNFPQAYSHMGLINTASLLSGA